LWKGENNAEGLKDIGEGKTLERASVKRIFRETECNHKVWGRNLAGKGRKRIKEGSAVHEGRKGVS